MMNNENGRSMVEMLGVLAIIGVLSVAGIAGYSMAMKKYRTNEVLNTASQLVVLAQAEYVSGGDGIVSTAEAGLGDSTNHEVAGYAMTATCTGTKPTDCTVTTTTTGADKGNNSVWKAAQDQARSTYYSLS